MKLKIRYENKYQILEVNSEEMWVSLSLEGDENLTQEEKEAMIQEAFEEQFNRPEYNSWHKFNRHRGNLKRQFRKDDEEPDESDGIDTVADNSQEEERNGQYEYEALCQQIRKALKSEYADVIIAVCLDDMTPEEYALKKRFKKGCRVQAFTTGKKENARNFLKLSNLTLSHGY